MNENNINNPTYRDICICCKYLFNERQDEVLEVWRVECSVSLEQTKSLCVWYLNRNYEDRVRIFCWRAAYRTDDGNLQLLEMIYNMYQFWKNHNLQINT